MPGPQQLPQGQPGAPATASTKTTAFSGLNYAQDRRGYKEPTVCDGANFTLTAMGVKADFGDDLITETVMATPEGIQTFRQNGSIVLMDEGVILGFDSTSGNYYPLFQFEDAGYEYPWTQAYVGDNYYYAKYGVGLIEYNVNNNLWHVVTENDVPANIYGCCQAYGRCIVSALGLGAWSNIDDGTTWTTDANLGTGSVDLGSVAGSPIPVGISPITVGFIIATQMGIMRGISQQATSPFFTHELVVTDVPLNPFCIVPIDGGKCVYLAKTGLWVTQSGWAYNEGDQPTPWNMGQLLSEYLVQEVFPGFSLSNNLAANALIRLTYNQDRRWFAVSIATTQNPYLYVKAFVLYMPINQWGSFDKLHYAFGELDLAQGPYQGYNFGYVDTNGMMRRFTPSATHTDGSRQTIFTRNWRKQFDPPCQQSIGGSSTPSIFATGMHLDADDFTGLEGLAPAVYVFNPVFTEVLSPFTVSPLDESVIDGTDYEYNDWLTNPFGMPNEDWNLLTGNQDWLGSGYTDIIFRTEIQGQCGTLYFSWQIAPPNLSNMGSFVTIGPYRFDAGLVEDQLSYTSDIVIGTSVESIFNQLDYLTSNNPNQDWNAIDGIYEDWGFNFPSTSGFSATLIGTLDAYSQWEEESYVLTAENEQPYTIFYKAQCNGIYHLVQVETVGVDDFFYLKYVGITGTLGGRLN